VGTTPAILSPEGSVFSVEIEFPQRIYAFGITVDPLVEEVEMVAGLVNPQGSALSDEPVPSPEIVSPMRRIKIPVKIDGGEFPNFSFPKELPHLYPVGRIAVIECNPALFPAPFFRIDYLLHLYFLTSTLFLALFYN
jgi:hypothetical protein